MPKREVSYLKQPILAGCWLPGPLKDQVTSMRILRRGFITVMMNPLSEITCKVIRFQPFTTMSGYTLQTISGPSEKCQLAHTGEMDSAEYWKGDLI